MPPLFTCQDQWITNRRSSSTDSLHPCMTLDHQSPYIARAPGNRSHLRQPGHHNRCPGHRYRSHRRQDLPLLVFPACRYQPVNHLNNSADRSQHTHQHRSWLARQEHHHNFHRSNQQLRYSHCRASQSRKFPGLLLAHKLVAAEVQAHNPRHNCLRFPALHTWRRRNRREPVSPCDRTGLRWDQYNAYRQGTHHNRLGW